MNTRLALRAFTAADAPALTKMLHRAYAELGNRGLNFTAVDQDESTTLYRAQGGRTWVMSDGGAIAASLTMSLPPGKVLQGLSAEASVPGRAWLNQLAVDPRFRGAGLASRLWSIGRTWARAAGASQIGLDTAVPATHLISLYAHWGFHEREVVQWPGKTYVSTVMIYDIERGGDRRRPAVTTEQS